MAKKQKHRNLGKNSRGHFHTLQRTRRSRWKRPLDIARVIRHSWTGVKQSVNV